MPEGRGAAIGWFESNLPHVKCPHCGEVIQGMGVMGAGLEPAGRTKREIEEQKSRDRMEDVNASTRPGEVTLADLRRKR
jgi:hypothetical protein